MTARDFGDDAAHDYLIVANGAVTTLSAYTLVCLFKPNSVTRGAAIGIRNAGGFAVQMIRDSGKWFYGGDFSAGYSGFTAVADHWTWGAITHPAGSNVCTWHHKDITAGGSIVHGAGGFAVGNPGAITQIRIGDGDNESHDGIALGAVYGSVLSNTDLDAVFSLSAADAFGFGPLAMWIGASDLETDVTGGGADFSSTVGTVGSMTDPPGFDYSLSGAVLVDMEGDAAIGGISGAGQMIRTVNMTGAMAVGGVSGSGQLDRIVNASGAAGIGGVSGSGQLHRTVDMAGSMGVGGITGRGSMIEGALAGRRPIVTISRGGPQVSRSTARPIVSRAVHRVTS